MNSVEWHEAFPFSFGHEPQQHYLSLMQPSDHGRTNVESFIQNRFRHVHGADVRQFMPELLAMRNHHGALNAAVGIRLADGNPLFLEQYLESPVENRLSALASRPVARHQVVEVGNLASMSAGNARLIIVAVTWLLARRGLEWVVFTGATTLINSFRRLGLDPLVLGQADPQRLGQERELWGTYYEQRPQVFAGNILYGYAQLEQCGVFDRLGFPQIMLEADHAA
ncbi:thermostable hemolysin [Metapseudomonas boanensis]|uniref:Thermostable hemolysin n=1 Tax=Metapseudomonas boanensis TaxID=2822138 RepID=A0ABS5XFR3_9GAMM|nr:thermostable hemolysin [Pseudomonas boanensis]MBT8766528.1 thermostable hemolysin [Pseudomonas boanensis]